MLQDQRTRAIDAHLSFWGFIPLSFNFENENSETAKRKFLPWSHESSSPDHPEEKKQKKNY